MNQDKLSAFIDGEYQEQDFLDTLCNDKGLQTKLLSYQLTRAAIRNESQILLGETFSAKLAQLIEQEQAIQTKAKNYTASTHWLSTLRHRFAKFKPAGWLLPVGQVAVAAGVCTVAVIGTNHYLYSDNPSTVANNNPVLQTLPFANNTQPVSYSFSVSESKPLGSHAEKIHSMSEEYKNKTIYLNEKQ